MDKLQQVCELAAREGGRELLGWRGRISPTQKSRNDFVTEADLASQRCIRELIRREFPDHRFLGEELEAEIPEPNSESEYCWIVDPLDGTLNFMHGLPPFCVSVAIRHRDQIVAGTVFDPVNEECYTAARGAGAQCNGAAINVSRCQRLADSLVVASFSSDVQEHPDQIDRFLKMLGRVQAIRRLGSAALNLCYVAAGRLDAYWATSVSIWDVAAGALIIEEAGGVMQHIAGRPFELDDPRFIAASSQSVAGEMLEVFAQRAE